MKETTQIQRIVFLLALFLLFLCMEEAFGWPWSRKGGDAVLLPDAPEDLQPALSQLEAQEWDKAMVGFWMFMADKQGHEEGYCLAQLGMAKAARALGLKQLATETYAEIVRSSMNQAITLQALDALEKLTHEEIYDEQTIVEEVLYEKEFGTLPENLNNFANYYQALMDYRNGYPRWASNHVEKLEGKDEYFYRARILEALWALKEEEIDACQRILESVAEQPGLDRTVRNEAKKALARVLYEKGDFRDAYRLYREIDASELTLADVILEEAWAKYREKDYRKAMGLLVAFNAPSFERLFKPEQYLLKTLIFMQFCHYGAAHEALAAFQDRYGDVLACIRQRGDLTENPQASGILKGLPAVERVEKYLQELQQEKSILVSLQGLEGFVETFQPVYDLKEREVARRLYRVRNREVERLKRILFDYQEQANLLAYESGMHQYKKVKEMYYRTALGDEAKAKEVIPRFSKNTYYEFDGEYWSDELDDYTFVIEDYCETPEKWAEDPGANTQKE